MSVEHKGELFWESGLHQAAQEQELLLFPGVPLHGKSPEHAMLVGIIDSGITQVHPQLAGYIRAYADFGGDGLADTLGHGTLVALQLLYANGVSNPAIAILSAKVTDAQGSIRQQSVVDAIEWVVQQGARLVNLSLGFLGSAEEYRDLCAAIARHADVVFVVAAGNYGPGVKVYPAACGHNNILTVGATDKTGKPAGYSGAGDVYAPGNALFAREWAYYYEQGQAFARAGHLQEARRAYEHSLALHANAESEFQLGVLDLAETKPEASINRFLAAINLNPTLAEVHEMLGAAHMLLGDYRDAEMALRKSIELYSQNEKLYSRCANAHFNLGQTLVNLGRAADARAQFEAVKALSPDYPHIDDAIASLVG